MEMNHTHSKYKFIRLSRIKKESSEVMKNNISAWLFLFPFLFLYGWFMLYPIIKGFYISLTKGSFGVESEFVWFENYIEMFKDYHFWEALWNTVYFVFISTPTIVVIGLIMALIVNSKLVGTSFLRSIFFMPYMLAISVVTSIWVFILQPYTGLLNSILHQLGIEKEIFWLSEPTLAWFSILFATLWWTVGFNMVLFLAGLQEIPDEIYEAAEIDGAGPWKKFWYITLPSLKGVMVLVIILQSIASFKLFGQPWLMTGGGPGTSTRPLVQYIYEVGFKEWNPGYASAMSYVLFLVMIIFAFIQYKLMSEKRGE